MTIKSSVAAIHGSLFDSPGGDVKARTALMGAVLALAAYAAGTSPAAAAVITYDANAAFVAMESASAIGVNPFGPFSVGYGTSAGSFTAFSAAQHTNFFAGNASLQGYFVNNPQIVPAAVVNIATTQTVIDASGITALDAGQIFLHPGSLSLTAAHEGLIYSAILRFTAPTSGSYRISGDWESLHFGSTSNEIWVNSVQKFGDTADNSVFDFLSVSLNANDHVDFLVNPNGLIAGDSTGLRARLTTEVQGLSVPEPSVFQLLAMAVFALIFVQRRGRKSAAI